MRVLLTLKSRINKGATRFSYFLQGDTNTPTDGGSSRRGEGSLQSRPTTSRRRLLLTATRVFFAPRLPEVHREPLGKRLARERLKRHRLESTRLEVAAHDELVETPFERHV